jgi:hypothetical protein
MTLAKSLPYRPWHRLLFVLLILVMMITPFVSTMAELHESEHLSFGEIHFNTDSDQDTHLAPDQNSDTEESSLHFLAHASHCCGHIAALLPNILHLILMPTQSALGINREHSHIDFLRISHFRPPIFL